VGYLILACVLLAVAFAVIGFAAVRSLRSDRPHGPSWHGVIRRYRPSEGDSCRCGNGTLYATKGRFGPFLGCTNYPACGLAWTVDGRRIRRDPARRVPHRPLTGAAATSAYGRM
jgi:hypothetical protein